MLRMNRFPLYLILGLLLSCVRPEAKTVSSDPVKDEVIDCSAISLEANLSDPHSIEELIDLINILPKPLNTDCLISSLKRPLLINATSSTLSAQPASDGNPRIFIFKGDLIITIVTGGEGAKVLEFSELTSQTRSIKGELPLPIRENISYSSPFSKISRMNQTTCSGCHRSETLEFDLEGVAVYSSLAFRPTTNKLIPLETLKQYHYVCQALNDSSQRCSILSALFKTNEVSLKEFPSEFPLFLSVFGG